MDSFFWGGGFEAMFFLIFALCIGLFLFVMIRGIGEWNRNNHSPRLEVEATVVTKRTNVSHHRHANGGDISGAQGFHTAADTSYYVTFQVASKDRLEFHVSGSEYGMLAEGDCGTLSFQGSRYLGFERA